MKVIIYLDGFPVEHCFSMPDLRKAMAYWSLKGQITVQNDPKLIVLHAPNPKED